MRVLKTLPFLLLPLGACAPFGGVADNGGGQKASPLPWNAPANPIGSSTAAYAPSPAQEQRANCVEEKLGEFVSSLPINTPVERAFVENQYVFAANMGAPVGSSIIARGVSYNVVVAYNDSFAEDFRVAVEGHYLDDLVNSAAIIDLGVNPDENGEVPLVTMPTSPDAQVQTVDGALAQSVVAVRAAGRQFVAPCFG